MFVREPCLYLSLIVDDAAIVFINGQEIQRTPTLHSGAIAYDKPPTTRSSRYDEPLHLTYTLPVDALQLGQNTLAVQVFDEWIGKKYADRGELATVADVAFDAKLSFEHQFKKQFDGPYVFYENNQVIVKSITPNGVESEVFESAEQATITVELPSGLGNFNVDLRGSFAIEPWDYAKPNRFFMTSDIEGNIEALVYMLVQAGVMDSSYQWTYGNGHLYHMGDLFDRGHDVAESLWLLYHLETQARAAGGDVHFIVGNHDMMNLYGDWRYVHPRYQASAALLDGLRLIDLYGENTELGRWIRSKNIMERGGDILFVHAGLKTSLIEAVEQQVLSLEEINDIGRMHMDQGYFFQDDKRYLPSRLYWDRSVPTEQMPEEVLDRGLAAFGASLMVIGHTVFDQPSFLYGNKVLAVDVHHYENYQEQGFVQATEYLQGQFEHMTASELGGITRQPVQPYVAP